MHLVEQHDIRPIESESELRSYFEDACKPPEQWRVGTERELIGVRTRADALGRAPGYEGDGLGAVLDRMVARGWAPVQEGDHLIALICRDAQVSFEPGGQLELAARPLVHTSELKTDLDRFADTLDACSAGLDLTWLGMGFRPFGTRDDVPWMPKDRYVVMRSYLGPRGALAHEMMKRTATVQVNLDYGDAQDAAEKMRAAMGVSSILTAIYAYSPIVDGADSGYQSFRTRVWRDTDADRCGLLPLAFADDGDVFGRYIDWALDVPMFFVYREGYQPAGGMTFRRFLREGFQGHRATMDDWALHLSTLFPEVRIKRFLEVRGCDSGSRDMALALGPLCQGLLYDATARQETMALTAGLDFDQRIEMWDAVARAGLRARVPGSQHTVGDLARELVAIATAGLERCGPEELPYLEPVRAIVDSGRTQADDLRDLWNRVDGDPAQVIAEVARAT